MMLIRYNRRGVERQISSVEEEKRCVWNLINAMQMLCSAVQSDPLADPGRIGECLDDLQRVRKSIEWRITMLTDMIRDAEDVDERIDGILKERAREIEWIKY